MQHQIEPIAPAVPQTSVWAIMLLSAVFGFLTMIAIPQWIRSQARREVAELKAKAHASVDVSAVERQ